MNAGFNYNDIDFTKGTRENVVVIKAPLVKKLTRDSEFF